MDNAASTRIGKDARLVRRTLSHGLSSTKTSKVGSCYAAIYAFIFRCHNVPVSMTAFGDVIITGICFCPPHPLQGPEEPKAADIGLCHKPRLGPWHQPSQPATVLDGHPPILRRDVRLEGRASARGRISPHIRVTSAISYCRSSTSRLFLCLTKPAHWWPNELVNFLYPKPWIMHRVDWSSDAMFSLYFGSHILLNNYSECFFRHLRRAVTMT